MCSCDTKQHAISQLEKLSKELYLESGNYTEADWQKAKVRFQEIETKIAKHSTEYTEDEKKYIKIINNKNNTIYMLSGIKEKYLFIYNYTPFLNYVNHHFLNIQILC